MVHLKLFSEFGKKNNLTENKKLMSWHFFGKKNNLGNKNLYHGIWR